MPRSRSIAQRRRERRRLMLGAVAVILVALALPAILAFVGRDVPVGTLVLGAAAFVIVGALFAREAYLDARTRGLSVGRSVLAAVGGTARGWWSTGA